MVKEFTDLQGIVGGLYAREQEEPELVWRAIYEHYKPLSMEDDIPSTLAGCNVALADKIDTLRECFRVGLVPTGSKDPFGLRRAAQGVVKILEQKNLSLSVAEFLNDPPALRDFFIERIKYYFKDILGFNYDEVAAVVAADWSNIVVLRIRLIAIRDIRPVPDFAALAASFKRIKNMLKQADYNATGYDVQENLLEPGPERDLSHAAKQARTDVAQLKDTHKYSEALYRIAALRPQVDLFFDKVLVNAPDPAVRRNRLALLHSLLQEFSTIADFSEIVTER
jgi:glycyl-tRNA synthetase beta chain